MGSKSVRGDRDRVDDVECSTTLDDHNRGKLDATSRVCEAGPGSAAAARGPMLWGSSRHASCRFLGIPKGVGAMKLPTIPVRNDLGAALGRIPSGLYILTARQGGRDTGMLASWVQQAGFQPPMLTVALRQDRYQAAWLAEFRRFTLNQIPTGHKPLIRHFAKGFEPDQPAFDGLDLVPLPAGGPILAEALAYLDLEVVDHMDSGDHRIFLGRVLDGAVFHPDADPMVHVRRDGFHY
jgi:flavin reductase (DIM6/NTAB) family NADH-FMN oxidoreductase RutF